VTLVLPATNSNCGLRQNGATGLYWREPGGPAKGGLMQRLNAGWAAVLPACTWLWLPAAAQTPASVAMPDDIKCDAAINAKTSVDNKGAIAIGDGTVARFRSLLSGAKAKNIALMSPALKDGILVTKDFGSIRVAGVMVPNPGIPPIHAEFRFSVDKDMVVSLRAYLQAK